MTLKKVIEILRDLRRGLDLPLMTDEACALSISIEATKAVIALRNKKPTKIWELLPGETED